MLTAGLLLGGAVLLLLALTSRVVAKLPLSTSLIYLLVGWFAGWSIGAPTAAQLLEQAPVITIVTEAAVLVSLIAVGLGLGVPPQWSRWRVALLMAGPGMVVTVILGAGAAVWLLNLPWPAALLLAAIMAPTDPVLASDVQIHSENDRDAVRMSLTAEGGLNDGSALPAVMLALGLLGLHSLGEGARNWWLDDLLWAIGGGAALGLAIGWAGGRILRGCINAGDAVPRHELLYVGLLALAFGLARITGTSSFVVVFTAAVALMWPLSDHTLKNGGQALANRLGDFGQRTERLIEAAMVMSIGVVLHSVLITWQTLAFAAVMVLAVRPLSVFAVVRKSTLSGQQRRLVAWFGIRGIGTLFYLAFALEHGVPADLARELLAAALVAVALSIVLHGISATPLMEAYKRRRGATAAPQPEARADPRSEARSDHRSDSLLNVAPQSEASSRTEP